MALLPRHAACCLLLLLGLRARRHGRRRRRHCSQPMLGLLELPEVQLPYCCS
jgi:hypothetical protein